MPRCQGRFRGLTINRRLASGLLLAVATATALVGTVLSLAGDPQVGLVLNEQDSVVAAAEPGGPAWQHGIRPGQRVLQFDPGESPLEWSIQINGEEGPIVVRQRVVVESLRRTTPLSVTALALAGAAVLLFRTRLAGAGALCVASMLASMPSFMEAGIGALAIPSLVLTPVAAFGWVSLWLPVRLVVRTSLLAAVVIGSVGWVAARLGAFGAYELAESARLLTTATGAGLVMAGLVVRSRWRPALDLRRTADIVLLVALTAAGVALVFPLGVPVPAIVLGAVVILFIYPRLRRHASDVADRALFGALREEAGIEATEDERARVARELLDEPLQEIAGVIHRLEVAGGNPAEAAALRDVAAHLRRITTELRPPALDDLGLAAAIASIAESARHHSSTDVAIGNQIPSDIALPGDPRPPADVELAAFRIGQEAVLNAVLHSGATSITIGGHVRPRSVEVIVEDDGGGIDQEQLRRARLEGHLGMASMEQRAHLVNAHLTIGGRPGGGTRVHFV